MTKAPFAVRLRAVLPELVRFIVIGGACFVLDIALAYVLRFRVGLGPTTSKTLSTVLATVISYVGNRLWSFRHRVADGRTRGQDVTVYGGINVLGLIITLVPVDIFHYLLGLTSPTAFTVSGVIGTAVATVFRFWAYRRWVFTSAPVAVAAAR